MKQYIKPNVLIVNVRIEKILQQSLTSVSGLSGVQRGGTYGGRGSADSRAFDFWDDEDDE